MFPSEWRGLVAIILAAGVAISVVALCMGAVLQDETISAQGAALIETVLGASVGAVATYLGGRGGNRPPKETEAPTVPPGPPTGQP